MTGFYVTNQENDGLYHVAYNGENYNKVFAVGFNEERFARALLWRMINNIMRSHGFQAFRDIKLVENEHIIDDAFARSAYGVPAISNS